METYVDADGVERCDNCGETTGAECECRCVECGDHVTECACDDGPTYPAVTDY
jgi:hypothetical protein